MIDAEFSRIAQRIHDVINEAKVKKSRDVTLQRYLEDIRVRLTTVEKAFAAAGTDLKFAAPMRASAAHLLEEVRLAIRHSTS